MFKKFLFYEKMKRKTRSGASVELRNAKTLMESS